MFIDNNAKDYNAVLSDPSLLAEVAADIFDWGVARNITSEGGATSLSQMKKLAEEVIELTEALEEGTLEEIKLEAGDVLVVLLNVCRLAGIDLSECLEMAYNKIKDRKGIMRNGVFVKEADLGV